ncbi:MAG: hypothetical protein KKH04_03800 [Proteobacteria bacterium]|nr:hypothetical protein [Pseudomonadota bacterium]
MAKIAVIFAQKFEESEYRKPAEAFREAGHELIHVGGEEKKTEKRKTQEIRLISNVIRSYRRLPSPEPKIF